MCDAWQVYDYVQTCDGFVDRLLRHLNTSAMMDLLLQMVVAPDTNQTRLDIAQVHVCVNNVWPSVCMCACSTYIHICNKTIVLCMVMLDENSEVFMSISWVYCIDSYIV